MAYPYYPQNYYQQTQPTFMPQPQMQTPTVSQMQAASSNSSNLTWVQGESAAKSYPVQPGQSILLMDSENPVMYIKSTDQSGMPLPLRIFDYTERKNEHTTNANVVTTKNMDYVSRSEFDAFKSEIQGVLRQPKQNNNSNMKRTTTKEE